MKNFSFLGVDGVIVPWPRSSRHLVEPFIDLFDGDEKQGFSVDCAMTKRYIYYRYNYNNNNGNVVVRIAPFRLNSVKDLYSFILLMGKFLTYVV